VATSRTQNQLHIHIDCIWPDVAAALREAAPRLGAAWAPLDAPLSGMRFEARRLDGEDLTRNPFRLLARGDRRAADDMGAYTLAAVPEIFPGGEPGFILLAHRADLAGGDPAAGEAILDHTCKVLRQPKP
jgi:CDP-diacylglycerol pyrophosphatase